MPRACPFPGSRRNAPIQTNFCATCRTFESLKVYVESSRVCVHLSHRLAFCGEPPACFVSLREISSPRGHCVVLCCGHLCGGMTVLLFASLNRASIFDRVPFDSFNNCSSRRRSRQKHQHPLRAQVLLLMYPLPMGVSSQSAHEFHPRERG